MLRLTGLDELPQLWNILKGDMSLVGPRPERPFFVEQFTSEVPRYDGRHRVPVGLTGLAQVHGLRGDTSIDERARLDNQYIENWSLWRDVVILFQTFSAVIRNTFEPSRRVKRLRIATVTERSEPGPPGLESNRRPYLSPAFTLYWPRRQRWVFGCELNASETPYEAACRTEACRSENCANQAQARHVTSPHPEVT